MGLGAGHLNIKEHGFEIHAGFLNEESVKEIIDDIESLGPEHPKHGLRNAEKKLRSVKALVGSGLLRNKAKTFLPGEPQLVRVIVFDKTPERNWLVSWHQDKTITVSDRVEVKGWGPWTVKDGIHHVQPDLRVLEEMVTCRIHLDDADERNGCLKVIPKSHSYGILAKDEQDRIVGELESYACTAQAGDLLVMRPHLLHSSGKGRFPKGSLPNHRRIVHVEYSSFVLPKGIMWVHDT